MKNYLSIGIDSVDIDRFKNWHKYKKKQLSKIFSKQEIDYCLSIPNKAAERFSARFAAKEALLKAVTDLLKKKVNFFNLCSSSFITHTDLGNPRFIIDWPKIANNIIIYPDIACSITHTKITATAIVILY